MFSSPKHTQLVLRIKGAILYSSPKVASGHSKSSICDASLLNMYQLVSHNITINYHLTLKNMKSHNKKIQLMYIILNNLLLIGILDTGNMTQ